MLIDWYLIVSHHELACGHRVICTSLLLILMFPRFRSLLVVEKLSASWGFSFKWVKLTYVYILLEKTHSWTVWLQIGWIHCSRYALGEMRNESSSAISGGNQLSVKMIFFSLITLEVQLCVNIMMIIFLLMKNTIRKLSLIFFMTFWWTTFETVPKVFLLLLHLPISNWEPAN